jgi:uncharacterized damage-inducible protein DinB
MAIKDALLPEFEQEMKSTRTLLERVPDDKAAWKPHPKSMALGDLAMHVANIPFWGLVGLTKPEFDMAPPGGPKMEERKFESTAKMLAGFDDIVAQCRAALATTDDAAFQETWSLKMGGNVFRAWPRTMVMRGFVMNHLIHHRGQLTVYLRLLDVPLPSLYGPTADERGGF